MPDLRSEPLIASDKRIVALTKSMQERARHTLDSDEIEALRRERMLLIGAIRAMYPPDEYPELYR
jgi:hypothetical protein